jgi:hypothetical protein
MSRSKIRTARTAQDKLPPEIERMIGSYVNVVLSGQSERNKLAARTGLRVIVQRAVRGER